MPARQHRENDGVEQADEYGDGAVDHDAEREGGSVEGSELGDSCARHAGHAGARLNEDGSPGETHFRVRIVSPVFAGLSRVERQRRVYAALSDELASSVHALALTTLTPEEASRPA